MFFIFLSFLPFFFFLRNGGIPFRKAPSFLLLVRVGCVGWWCCFLAWTSQHCAIQASTRVAPSVLHVCHRKHLGLHLCAPATPAHVSLSPCPFGAAASPPLLGRGLTCVLGPHAGGVQPRSALQLREFPTHGSWGQGGCLGCGWGD